MGTIFNILHTVITSIIFVITLVCIDLPLKIFLFVFFILWAIVCSIIYPLIKNYTFPKWFCNLYDYLKHKFIARKVWKAWHQY